MLCGNELWLMARMGKPNQLNADGRRLKGGTEKITASMLWNDTNVTNISS